MVPLINELDGGNRVRQAMLRAYCLSDRNALCLCIELAIHDVVQCFCARPPQIGETAICSAIRSTLLPLRLTSGNNRVIRRTGRRRQHVPLRRGSNRWSVQDLSVRRSIVARASSRLFTQLVVVMVAHGCPFNYRLCRERIDDIGLVGIRQATVT